MSEQFRAESPQQEDGNKTSLLVRIQELSEECSSLEMQTGWLNNSEKLLERYKLLGELVSAQRQLIKILMGDTKN